MARSSLTSFLITSRVALVLLALQVTCGNAAAVLPPNKSRVQLLSWLTGRYLTVSSAGDKVNADGSEDNSDTYFIMESISVTEVNFKRENSNTFIMVTPEGKLKAVDSNETGNGSTVFTMSSTLKSSVLYHKLSTTVLYLPPTSTTSHSLCAPPPTQPPAQIATCYIAVDDIDTGVPPANVCDVASNDFAFDDEDSLLFHILTR